MIIHETLQNRLLHLQNWCADCTDAANQINFHYGELISANLVIWNVLFSLEYSGILALGCKTTILNAFLSMFWGRLEIALKNDVWAEKQHSKFMFLAFFVHKVIWKYMLMWQKEVEQITLWYSPMRSSFWTVVELSLLSLAILKYNWRQQHAVECWRTCSHAALSQKSRRTSCFFRDYRSICLLLVLIWWK